MADLSLTELAILRIIHEADRERGGIFVDELSDEEVDVCGALVTRGLAETVSEFGEAPDGEEDERDAGSRYLFRVTGRGVEALRDARGQ